jgi:hypothetical protein
MRSTSDTVSALAVVLVEGISDQLALEALAARRGLNLDAEAIAVVPMGGSKNIRSFLDRFGPQGLNVRLAGLCDAAEEGDFQRALDRAGLGSNLTRSDMERLGFYVCVADLEDELIRSLGPAAVERVIDAKGELEPFRSFQRQPAWRDRTHEAQLRRFFGTHGGRKIESAALLVDALDLDRVPRPLDLVLAHVTRSNTVDD